jgi:4-hydroxybenzoate polyprenyltransferase
MMVEKIRYLVQLARPKHWVKNLIVLFPVVFAVRAGDVEAWALAALAMAAFCMASSFVYVINDIQDRQRDRCHPLKKDRPLAAGRLGLRAALVEAGVLLAAAAALALPAGRMVLLVTAAYVLLQLSYTFFLKRKMIVDVVCIALGFVLRASAGAVAIHAAVSPWLIICTFTICLFMGFCKRRNELATFGDSVMANRHRPTLAGYTPELLTHLITLSAAVAIISFLLYASHPDTVKHFGTIYMVYTLPAVIYGICRFAMLSMEGKYADPTDLIVRDWPFQAALGAWSVAAVIIILWGKEIQAWIWAHS